MRTTSVILFFLLYIELCAFGQESQAVKKTHWWQQIGEKIDASFNASGEYDDNVYFDATDEDWDWKVNLAPTITFEDSSDKTYFRATYQNESIYYRYRPAWVVTHLADGQTTFFINDKFSMGVRNVYTHTGQTEPSGRILQLGYNINTTIGQATYRITDRLVDTIRYQHDYVDFSDAAIDDRIDRQEDILRNSLEYYLTSSFSSYLGHEWRIVDFDVMSEKEFETNKSFFGVKQKIPHFLKSFAEVSVETRDFKDRTGFPTRPFFTIGGSTIFSRYTTINASFSRSWEVSSRVDYFQYVSSKFQASLRRYLDPKMIFFSAFSYERQTFPREDQILTSTLPFERRGTEILTIDNTLTYLITSNISFDMSYRYSKRATDFVGEGNINNRITLGLRTAF